MRIARSWNSCLYRLRNKCLHVIISAGIGNAKTRFSWKFLRILETLARLKYFSRFWLCRTEARAFKNSHPKYCRRVCDADLEDTSPELIKRYAKLATTIRILSALWVCSFLFENIVEPFLEPNLVLFYKMLDQLVDRLEISQLTIGFCDTRYKEKSLSYRSIPGWLR